MSDKLYSHLNQKLDSFIMTKLSLFCSSYGAQFAFVHAFKLTRSQVGLGVY